MSKVSQTITTPKARSRRGVVNSTPSSGWIPYGHITQKQLDSVLAHVKRMTLAEKVESLKACGVLTPTGRLSKRYRS